MAAFPPLLGVNPAILILGSMPGQQSLAAVQYYAHPRNAFWPIMQHVFGVDSDANYQQRAQQLVKQGVCVWDVLHDCERPGSLDSNIIKTSEQPNDFEGFLNRHPSIILVAFNGQAAGKIFHRHHKGLYDQFPAIRWVNLPSSSPAYAAVSPQKKAELWAQKLKIKPT